MFRWFALVVFVAAIAVRLVIIPREEARLVAKFGDDSRRYRNHTGSLLPRLRQPGTPHHEADARHQ
jgi:protein-S-isoprenylcysteine O-methyltransferase Ste14